MIETSYPLALEINSLNKEFSRGKTISKALDNVSFNVEQGDFFGLLGPNGAGKSTLIGVLSSVVKPNSGVIKLLGMDFKTYWRQCKMAIGIVPQEITFDPHFTVWETLKLQSGYYGLRKNEKWINQLLDFLDLKEKQNDKVSSLSGGMKRRVLIAQALVHKPPIIILDEPTAGVDIELRHKLWNFMTELNRDGHTIILTTHYLEEAERLCNKVAMLNHGKLVALDSTSNLLARYSKERIKFFLPPGQSMPVGFPFKYSLLDNGFYSVDSDSPDSLRQALNALKDAGLTAEGLELGKANLEEVFLRITHDNDNI